MSDWKAVSVNAQAAAQSFAAQAEAAKRVAAAIARWRAARERQA